MCDRLTDTDDIVEITSPPLRIPAKTYEAIKKLASLEGPEIMALLCDLQKKAPREVGEFLMIQSDVGKK